MAASSRDCWRAGDEVFRTKYSKYAELGRNIDCAPIVSECVGKLSAFVGCGMPFYESREPLLREFRCMLARDPGHVPQVSLRAVRRWCCSNLWALGVSSAWLMGFMHHTRWATTKGYVVSDKVPRWRDCPCISDVGSKWLAKSALCAKSVSAPSGLGVVLSSQRRLDYIQAVHSFGMESDDEITEEEG